jgi:hypothetical protein
MSKQDYTLYIYKKDKRTKSGERLVSTTVWPDMDNDTMYRTTVELNPLYPSAFGYRMEYFPKMKTVKNLMTGADVQIEHDTPWCCNPASETYWSM